MDIPHPVPKKSFPCKLIFFNCLPGQGKKASSNNSTLCWWIVISRCLSICPFTPECTPASSGPATCYTHLSQPVPPSLTNESVRLCPEDRTMSSGDKIGHDSPVLSTGIPPNPTLLHLSCRKQEAMGDRESRGRSTGISNFQSNSRAEGEEVKCSAQLLTLLSYHLQY